MSNDTLLEILLPLSILLQLGAAVVAVRMIRITGKPLAWTMIAVALACMTLRRIILFGLLWTGAASEVSLASESLGVAISLLLFSGMIMVGSVFRSIQLARDKLETASRRLQDASVAGRVVLWEWDIISGTREWSSLVDDLLGFPPDGFPRNYRAWEARIHPEDLAGVQDAIRSNFETNAPYDVIYRIQRADGTYAWWHEVGHVNRDTNGSPISLAGASVDITDRKQREEEYATIIQTAMDGVIIASARTGRVLDVNDAYCRLVGYTRAELLTLRLADLEASETPGAVTAHLQRILRFGQDRFETSHRCKDGRSVDVLVSMQSLANGSRLCAFVSDISARKRGEAALRVRMAEIERFNQLTTARELRMIALKQEINRLAQEHGRAEPYVVLQEDAAGSAASQSDDVAGVDGAKPALPAAAAPLEMLPLRELLEGRQLQPLLESFSAAAGVSTAIVDLRGTVLAGANWQPICTDFYRVHERTWTRCVESETEVAPQGHADPGYTLRACRNGLQMAGAPIVIQDQVVGHLFLCQFFLEPPDAGFFRRQAAEFGFDEKAFLSALSRVPVIPREKLTPMLGFLTSCASLISQLGQERQRERQQARDTQRTTSEMLRQREAALNLVQDAMEARRQLEASEDELRQNRDMLQRILDSVPQAVFWKDRHSVYQGCNQVFAKTFNLKSPQEIVGRTDYDLIPSREIVAGYLADDREVMEHNRPKRHITECVQRPQDTIWVDTTKLPLVDKDGQVYGVLAVYEDITEKRAAEELMRQQNERHSFALDTLGAGEWELDLVSLQARRSEQHARIFGFDSTQAPWSFDDFLRQVVSGDRERVEKGVREGIRLGRDLDFECQITRRDGSLRWIWVRGRHVWDGRGKSQRLAGIVIDITDRKHEEALMRQSKEHLQLALIAVEDAIWDWVPTEKRLYWSPRLFAMLGYAPDEFVPTVETWETLLHPEDQPAVQAQLQQCMDGQKDEIRFEARFRTKSGGWFWVLVRGRVLARGLHGEILRMAGAHIDIAERKQNESMIQRQLEELQRWQAVMLGREQRMLELKREINLLLQRLNEPIRYPSAAQSSGRDALPSGGET